jgi:hypothetical protein
MDRPQAGGVELTDSEIDAAILSFAEPRWLKVARIGSEVLNALGLEDSDGERAVAARIEALVSAGKLEAQGDMTRWRWSEVRLPSAPSLRPENSRRTRS